MIEGSELPEDPEELAAAAQRNTVFCRIKPEQKRDLVAALAASGRYAAMIGDGVNDVPALKRARMAVAMGSGAQVTKGVADVVLLKDEFARLPQAVGEGRRIARNIHRLGRLYLTKTVYAAALILLVAIPGFAFPFLPRHLTLAAFLTIGIPSFVLALAPSDGPLYRGRLLRALAAFAVPAGLATALGSILSFFLVDTVFGGSLEAGRTAATTTLIVLGLSFVLLLERGPGREHIAIQSYMLALVAGLGALFAGILAIAPVRDFFEMELLSAAQWFLALLSAAVGLTIASVLWRLPQIERLESAVGPEAVGASGSRAPGGPRAPLGGSTNWLTIRFAAKRGSAPSRRRSILTSITTVLLPTCSGVGDGDDLVAEQAGGEDVELQLDRGEVVVRRDVAEGRPGGDGVAERGPDAAVDEAAGVQVALVDDDAAAGEGVLDLQRLDPEVAGEAAAEEGAHVLRGEGRAVLGCVGALAHRRRRAPARRRPAPSSRVRRR